MTHVYGFSTYWRLIQEHLCEFKASLGYAMSSRVAPGTDWDLSQNKIIINAPSILTIGNDNTLYKMVSYK